MVLLLCIACRGHAGRGNCTVPSPCRDKISSELQMSTSMDVCIILYAFLDTLEKSSLQVGLPTELALGQVWRCWLAGHHCRVAGYLLLQVITARESKRVGRKYTFPDQSLVQNAKFSVRPRCVPVQVHLPPGRVAPRYLDERRPRAALLQKASENAYPDF